ncbi:Ig-like domain-containing protein [Oerskovia paurometabola]|uniref:Ig-like domain-containing protein n=1 Tax=Oerskovia paurometabola TaxID=162170 RepID=UPI00380C1906
MHPAPTTRPARRRHQAVAACGALVLAATALGVSASPAQASDITATDDTALTGSGVPVTIDVLTNDQVAGEVASVHVGTVTGGDATTVDVGDDFRITFANDNPDYPNSSTARVFKTAEFTVPYTVTDTDGNTTGATLTVTVAGKPVSPTISSWIVNDPSTGVKAVTNLTQLDLRTYPQTSATTKSAVPGHGVTVTGLVDAEHATAASMPGGIELQASPRDYIGNDVVTLELTDTWGRSVHHKAGVSWVERAAVSSLRTKVGIGQSARVDLRQIVAGTSFANFTNGYFSSTITTWRGTLTTGAHAQDIVVMPNAGFVGTSNDSVGTRFTWAYTLVNPWKFSGSTGPATEARYNTMYIDVQAPPQAADVAASTTPGQAVALDLRTPATLPWAASTFDLRDAPQHGSVSVTGDGQVRYTPDDAFPSADALAATDTFTFAWIDDLGQESQAQASVTVHNLPTLADHALTTPAGVPVGVDLLTASFGDTLTITGVEAPRAGSADLSGTTGTYHPHEGFVGEDSFAYQGVDAHGQPAQGTVRIQVLGAPAIADQHHRTPRNTAVTFEPVLPASEAAYQPELELDAVGTPQHGTVTQGEGSTLVYSPDLGYLGPDQLTVRARDAWGRTAEASVTIEVYGELAHTAPPSTDAPPGLTLTALNPGAGPAAIPSDGQAVPGSSAPSDNRLASTGASVASVLAVGGLLLGAGVAGVLLRNRSRAA